MNTVSDLLSIGLGCLGFLFASMALITTLINIPLATYFYLGLHIATLLVAFPLVLRSLFLLDKPEFAYYVWLVTLSTLNFFVILSFHALLADPYSLLLALAISELLPLTMIIFHFYIEHIEDYPTPVTFTYPFL